MAVIFSCISTLSDCSHSVLSTLFIGRRLSSDATRRGAALRPSPSPIARAEPTHVERSVDWEERQLVIDL